MYIYILCVYIHTYACVCVCVCSARSEEVKELLQLTSALRSKVTTLIFHCRTKLTGQFRTKLIAHC